MADLDLVWRVSRVHLGEAGDVLVFGAVESASPGRPSSGRSSAPRPSTAG